MIWLAILVWYLAWRRRDVARSRAFTCHWEVLS